MDVPRLILSRFQAVLDCFRGFLWLYGCWGGFLGKMA